MSRRKRPIPIQDLYEKVLQRPILDTKAALDPSGELTNEDFEQLILQMLLVVLILKYGISARLQRRKQCDRMRIVAEDRHYSAQHH